MNHLLKILFAVSVIVGSYYYTDNSMERVQHATMKNLAYAILGDDRNPAYKRQQEKRLDNMLEEIEKIGFDTNEELLHALDRNPYIQNIKWNIKDGKHRDYIGLDSVILHFNLVDKNTNIPVTTTFFVKPKPSLVEFFGDPDFSRLAPMLVLEIGGKDKKVRIQDRAYVIFVAFYNEETTKGIMKKLTS